ncbi:MAG: spore coat protein [Clostridia bacterium]|nr:spore coat protein [Clostridia bacterium]
MTISSKETDLLKDLKSAEQLCIEKYAQYSKMAKSTALSALFSSMEKTEREHLCAVTDMLAGKDPAPPASISNSNNQNCTAYSYASEEDRKSDAFLCQDMLSTEKHVSSMYDVSIFEFATPAARKMLGHIQAEEQQHGEQLYAYMKANGMYA